MGGSRDRNKTRRRMVGKRNKERAGKGKGRGGGGRGGGPDKLTCRNSGLTVKSFTFFLLTSHGFSYLEARHSQLSKRRNWHAPPSHFQIGRPFVQLVLRKQKSRDT